MSEELVVAKAIRSGRDCDGEVPCPFCSWGPDEHTPQLDETGCLWLARAAIKAIDDYRAVPIVGEVE